MLELYYNLFAKFCYTDKYEEMELETDSLYLALAEENCENVYEIRKSKSGSCYAANTVKSRSLQMPSALYSLGRVVLNTQRNMIKGSLDCSRTFRCTEILCLCSKTCCCYDFVSNKLKFSSKGLNKRIFEVSGDGPLAKCRKM